MTKKETMKEKVSKVEVNNIAEVKTANKKHKQKIKDPKKTESKAQNKSHVDETVADITEEETKSEYEKSLENDINNLEVELKQKQQELEDKSTEYLKLYAEFDNFRKRTQQEKDEFAQYASGNVVRDLLPVLDSFDQSKTALDKDEINIKDFKEGFSLIYKQFSTLLADLKVSRIQTVGQKFDPFFHEAVAQTEDTEEEEGIIIQEFRSGYMIKDKVLRHAMVVVAK